MLISDNLLPDNSHLSIYLLGHMAIDVDGEPMAKIPGQKVAGLLAYLLCNPGPHTRTKLADLLWDDIPYDRYLPNLRSTLNRIPKIFKPYLNTTRDTVAFDLQKDRQQGVWVDVLAFQQLADQLPPPESKHSDEYIIQLNEIADTLVTMVDQYKGPFLDGLALEDAPRFSDWQFIQREYLQRLALDCLRNLVELNLYQGQYADGIAYARRMIALDPLDEEARRQLMVMLARSDQLQTALKEYDALVEMLDKEFDAPPSPETMTAYEQISMVGKPDEGMPSKLPTFAQPPVGRRTELAALTHQLQMPDCRLVTITGLGGTGKTYLAVEAAKMMEKNNTFLQGVAYIPLAGVQSADRLPEAIFQALDLVLSNQRDLITQICNYLEPKEMLLVLDNFEHLLTTAESQKNESHSNTTSRSLPPAKILAKILDPAPQVKLLTTSRQPLRLQHEYLFPLSGMMLPQSIEEFPLSELIKLDAVHLFQQVALRNNPMFQVTEENREAVLEFCLLVQGTPLAIVLGAAHMDFLTPEELLDECRDSLDVLEAEWSDLPDRQRSVRGVFEYSWHLLDNSLQLIFQKLTIFQGGFTRQAARQVAGASIQHLKQLHNQSLIQLTDKGRYEIHELLRQFGTEKLQESGDSSLTGEMGIGNSSARQSVWDRHMQFYLNWLGQQTDEIQGAKPHTSVKAIHADINNVRLAWNHAIAQHNVALLAKSCNCLSIFYEMEGFYQEALDTFTHAAQSFQSRITLLSATEPVTVRFSAPEHALETTVETTVEDEEMIALYCTLLTAQSTFYNKLGDYQQAIEQAELAVSLAHSMLESSIKKNYIQAMGSWAWGWALHKQTDYQVAYEKADQALISAQQTSDDTLIAKCFYLRGFIHFLLDQYDEALQDAEKAQALYVQRQDRWREIDSFNQIGVIHEWLGNLSMAEKYYRQALEISHEIDNGQKMHRLDICRTDIAMGKYATAHHTAEKAFHFFQNAGDKLMIESTHHYLGLIYNKLGLYQEAQEHLEQAIQLPNTDEEQVENLIALSMTHNGLGLYEEALRLLKEAQQIAAKLDLNYVQAELSKFTAYTLNLLGQTTESLDAYKQALSFYIASKLEYTVVEIQVELAGQLWQSGDMETAASYIEEALSYVHQDQKNIYLIKEPFEFYLNCYEVLNASQDQRALSILDEGYTLLQSFAGRIKNKTWHSSFLKNVVANRKVIELWAQSQDTQESK